MRRIFSRLASARKSWRGLPASRGSQALGSDVPLGIVADDLTGAGDTGVQFSRRGAEVLVLLSLERLPLRLSEVWDVVVVNSGSRNAEPEDARRQVHAAMAFLARHDIPVVYKKIDSTLRGNLIPELAEAFAAGVPRAYVAPAFPATGRTVEDGVLKVHGVPVHETEIGRDPLSPVRTGVLAELLAGACPDEPPVLLRPGADTGAVLDGARLVICDAANEADLEWLAARLLPELPGPLLVGSAGLARALAEQLTYDEPRAPAHPRVRHGPVVVVAGTRSAVTAGQMERLCRDTTCRETVVAPEWVDGDWSPARAEAVAGRVLAELEGPWGRDVALIRLGTGEADPADPAAFTRRSGRLNEVLGVLVRHLAESWAPRGLVLTGGDIATAVLEALDGSGIRLGEEVAPGIPTGTLVGGPAEGLPLVTKAGAFGEPDALVLAARRLHDLAADTRSHA